uniref:Sodium/hydrogen exchanger 2 n=1 Tax=Anthurium amnicola TaxID=1678845 RepID=A0A1D1YLX7_9ARAE
MVSETAPSSLFLGGVLSPSSALLSSTVTVGYIALFVALLCVCVVIGHLLEENRWANESITALLLGLCAGFLTLVLSKWHSSRLLTFDDELFFIYLLPPIIFNAGFQVKKKQFFRNFSMILLFGVLGTLISFCFISVGSFFLFKEIGVTSFATQDILAIGAIFSATDSVCTLQILNQEQTPLLYSLVFGEGVVNDATSVVLFNAVQQLSFDNIDAIIALKLLGTFLYLFFTSTALGIAAGLLSAYTIKKLCFGRHSTDREVAMMFLVAYLSYLLAQLCSLSGILTIFFCGIIMSHYTWHNVTENSRITTRHAFATISFISEIFIFLCVGMDALDIDKWKESDGSVRTTIAVSGILLALLMVGRAAFVFPLAYLANCFRSTMKVDLCQQFIIWWAGLMRGAVTIALSYEQFGSSSKDGAFIITNSIIVVLFSTVVFGSITKPLIQATLFQHLKTVCTVDIDPPSLEDIRLLFLENGVDESGNNLQNRSSGLRLIIMHPTSAAHYFWRKFDDRYMRPVFGGRGFMPFLPSSPTSVSNENN